MMRAGPARYINDIGLQMCGAVSLCMLRFMDIDNNKYLFIDV